MVRSFWSPQLATWRPRYDGQQLKALKARYPSTDIEWKEVETAVSSIQEHLQYGPQLFISDLRKVVATCQEMWKERVERNSAKGEHKLWNGGMSVRMPVLWA
jgi:hypothetical protein